MRTILIWYESGGPLIAPLLAVGVAGLLLLIERFYRIVLRTRINARPFMERVISLVRAGKLDEALKVCADHQSALPDLGLVILRTRSANEADLRNVANAATLTVTPTLTRRLEWVPVLVKLAVLLGVLGAIVNLHEALTPLVSTAGDGRSTVAAAIVFALRPLGIATLTALALVAGHAYLAHEARHIIGQLDEFSARLVNAVIDRPDVRLGHRD